MDEELNGILANTELDDTKKAEAIKNLIGEGFVARAKYNAEKNNIKTKDEAYNNLKAEFEAFKQSKMTDEEKQLEQRQLLQEQAQKANLTISKMYAENTFAKAGFKEEDYSGILDNIVTEDPDKTKGIAETICNVMLKQQKDVEKKIKDNIVKNTKTPLSGNDGDSSSSELENYKKQFAEAQKNNDFIKMSHYTRLIAEAEQK